MSVEAGTEVTTDVNQILNFLSLTEETRQQILLECIRLGFGLAGILGTISSHAGGDRYYVAFHIQEESPLRIAAQDGIINLILARYQFSIDGDEGHEDDEIRLIDWLN